MPSLRSNGVQEPRAEARGSRPAPAAPPAHGYSFVEVLLVLVVTSVALAIAVPVLDRAADTADAAAAARYVASIVARARFDAARQQRARAVRFTRGSAVAFTVVADGDGDGVSAADVAAGVDPIVRAADTLGDHFPRARFGVAGAMPAIDEARLLTSADDPIRLGSADQLTLGPLGTATSGTVYIASRAGAQFAVRIAGVTGRARVLRYDPGPRAWRPYLTAVERRGATRRKAAHLGFATPAVLRPGVTVAVLELSAGGALVESTAPVRPGASTELGLDTFDGRRHPVRASVVRCWVSALHPLRYRCAVRFDDSLTRG